MTLLSPENRFLAAVTVYFTIAAAPNLFFSPVAHVLVITHSLFCLGVNGTATLCLTNFSWQP